MANYENIITTCLQLNRSYLESLPADGESLQIECPSCGINAIASREVRFQRSPIHRVKTTPTVCYINGKHKCKFLPE